jgi:hypothetical protein
MKTNIGVSAGILAGYGRAADGTQFVPSRPFHPAFPVILSIQWCVFEPRAFLSESRPTMTSQSAGR